MLKKIEACGIGPAPCFDLDLQKRLNVITGDNGLGKSLLLDLAWWACSGDWPERPVVPQDAVLQLSGKRDEPKNTPAPRISTVISSGSAAYSFGYSFDKKRSRWEMDDKKASVAAGLVLYARIDGGFSIWDPARPWYPSSSRNAAFGKASNSYHFTRSDLWNGKTEQALYGQQGRTLCEGLLHDWLEWEKREPALFETFIRVLEHLSPPGEEIRPADAPVRLPGAGVSSIPALRTDYGVLPLIHASAAVRQIITWAYCLVWAWREHRLQCEMTGAIPETQIILMIDEVEAHLHPKWQRLIVPALLTVADHLDGGADMQFLVTTHSPLVLASLEQEFDQQSDALFHLALQAGVVTLDTLPWQSYGDVSGWLTSPVFALGEARSWKAEQVIEEIESFMRRHSPEGGEESERKRLDDALRTVLPPSDPVWARWQFFRQRAMKTGSSQRGA